MPEAGIEKMKHGVFRAANVRDPPRRDPLDRALRGGPSRSSNTIRVPRPTKRSNFWDRKIADSTSMSRPIGAWCLFPVACRGVTHPFGRFGRGLRGAGGLEIFHLGLGDRQFTLVQRPMSSARPNDRKRLAPIALAREKPISQLKVDRLSAAAPLLEPGNDFGLRAHRGKLVKQARVDGYSFAAEGLVRRFSFGETRLRSIG